MLGWNISVHRQASRRGRPASFTSRSGARIAVWQGGLDAISWLETLIPGGTVIDLGGDGYPRRMTALAGAILPTILAGPPAARTIWLAEADDRFVDEPDDTLGTGWLGRTTIDRRAVEQCSPDEWLLLDLWDES